MPDPETSTIPKRTSREYRKERSEFSLVLKDECSAYDKSVLQLSAAAIGVSVAFLDKIATPPFKWCILLAAAWIVLVFSMLSMVLSYFCSRRTLERHIINLDREQRGESKEPDFKLKTEYFNHAGGIFLTVGFLLLVAFTLANLTPNQKGETQDAGQTTREQTTVTSTTVTTTVKEKWTGSEGQISRTSAGKIQEEPSRERLGGTGTLGAGQAGQEVKDEDKQ